MKLTDPHDIECASAALALLLERAIKDHDRKKAREIRKMMKEILPC